MSRFSFGLVVLFLVATPAAAAIDYTSQFRSVDAVAGLSGGGIGTVVADHDENSALGFWSGAASAAYADDLGSAGAIATQISDLADQLSMSGSVSGGGTEGNYGGGSRSDLNIVFSLASDSPYFSAFSTTGTTASSIILTAVGSGTVPFNANGRGVLAAGDYGLTVTFSAQGGGGTSGGGTYMYSLSIIPEPSTVCSMLVGALIVATTGRRNCRR